MSFYGIGKYPLTYVRPQSSGSGSENIDVVLQSSGSVTLTSSALYTNQYFYTSTSNNTVTLPATTGLTAGSWIQIKNAQTAGTLTVENSSSTTLATLSTASNNLFVVNGTVANGWAVF